MNRPYNTETKKMYRILIGEDNKEYIAKYRASLSYYNLTFEKDGIDLLYNLTNKPDDYYNLIMISSFMSEIPYEICVYHIRDILIYDTPIVVSGTYGLVPDEDLMLEQAVLYLDIVKVQPVNLENIVTKLIGRYEAMKEFEDDD